MGPFEKGSWGRKFVKLDRYTAGSFGERASSRDSWAMSRLKFVQPEDRGEGVLLFVAVRQVFLPYAVGGLVVIGAVFNID